EPEPFTPDEFQVQAVRTVMREDCLVSAPTGSGKTWIALEAARKYFSKGLRTWYATPLKALSNAKYEEFGLAFGGDRVGILTGDRKENADAPIVVGTTEILRNQLYDAMESGVDLGIHLVILDEAHYLGDEDRGVVWEEVLIYLPSRVRLLLLSATISNAHEISRWLSQVRNAPCTVVQSRVRPVPLHVLFRTPNGNVTPFLRGERLFPTVSQYAQGVKQKKYVALGTVPDLNGVVDSLRQFDLLPAIVFLKSRADCDRALQALPPSPRVSGEESFREEVEALLEMYPELEHHRQLGRFLKCRAGAHHAGQLPGWRLLIEKMMALGYLEVIFSTSTVAAGVNFPARTVVIVQSDRFNGRGFVDMTATDLHQMAGRAGRRGMDKVGFMLVVPGKHLDISLVRDLALAEPEALKSRISVNSSMVLNLLLSHDPAGVRSLLGQSFAAFHENPRRAEKVHLRLLKNFQKQFNLLEELGYVESDGTPTYDGRWAARLRLDQPLLIAELIRGGELDGLTPEELAALLAPFAIDKDRDILVSKQLWDMTRPLWKRFRRAMRRLKPLVQFMVSRGFDPPPIMFWPAAAVFLWADGVEWTEFVEHVGADEGDLAMLILRAADHLRQLRSVEGEMPELAELARIALPLLMRPPLI
ncbi:MAG: DEAD/DEAH box helicase, partial [Desulfomonilaceae bacterium]|nr:DEAD/DEAH box helicase [Desulfomonilaceae bacterium]